MCRQFDTSELNYGVGEQVKTFGCGPCHKDMALLFGGGER